ncbi:MAG TPA: uracil-DNA glycosylase [Bacteroidota bacterium]|nr:uracil-DNA glycosylase [Bacteroidota bacterium]
MSDLHPSSPRQGDEPVAQEISRLISGIRNFLMQEQDLFGNTIYPSAEQGAHSKEGKERSLGGYPAEPWANASSLNDLNSMICECQKCPLGATRTKFVFGVGNPNAELVLIGEAPGADEDAKGEPFVGRAGQLLNKILEAVHFKREDVYICNILKCRPPNNRDPLPEEVRECEPYLWKQLEIIKPKIILCLGRISAQVLLKTTDSLTSLRANVHDYRGIPLMVTYHPAALLRNPNWKRPTWEDVQRLRKMYDELKK